MTLELVVNRDSIQPNQALEAMGELTAAIDRLSVILDLNPEQLISFMEDLKFERDCIGEIYWRLLMMGTKAELIGVMGRTKS